MDTAEKKTKEISLVYRYQDGLYINLTSRCPTACRFCIKFSWDYMYRGYNLKLPGEPTVQEIMAAADDVSGYKEVVFCGYGESTYRLSEMKKLAALFRQKGIKKVRLNTIGLGNLIHNRNIAPDLGEFIDSVSVSLNTVDPEHYLDLHRPLPEFRERALESVKEFIGECVKSVPETVVSAVDNPDIDTQAVGRVAASLGAKFRLRPYLDDYQET